MYVMTAMRKTRRIRKMTNYNPLEHGWFSEGRLTSLIFIKDKAIEIWDGDSWKDSVIRVRPIRHFPDKRRRDDGTYKKHGTFFDKGDTPEKIDGSN